MGSVTDAIALHRKVGYSFENGHSLMIVLTLTAIVVLALVAATVLLIRTIGSRGQSLPVTADWISDLSVEHYKPMLRLLDSADIEFLRSQPGYTRDMESKLRAQRCQVFRGYLRSLTSDFQRVCIALKIVMVQSEQDRPDLASVLMHQQVLFATSLLGIHFRLALYRWGICTVDVTNLVRIYDGMRIELCNMVPSAVPNCA
jgi:hypothetical protein